jgi:hypothetical protein
MFKNKLLTLKQLLHYYLVKLISSYTNKKFLGLIMLLIANMNLK